MAIREVWGRFRGWVRDWATARERCARAERELRLQRSINGALGAKVKRLEREGQLFTEMYGAVPGLSPAEIERLAILAEECGEVARAVGKVLRHGWESVSPYGGRPNRQNLEREIGQLRAIATLMIDQHDLDLASVQRWQRAKRIALPRWTHYQADSMPREDQLAMMASIQERISN